MQSVLARDICSMGWATTSASKQSLMFSAEPSNDFMQGRESELVQREQALQDWEHTVNHQADLRIQENTAALQQERDAFKLRMGELGIKTKSLQVGGRDYLHAIPHIPCKSKPTPLK